MSEKREKHLIYKEDLLDEVLGHFGMDLAYLGEDLQFCQEAIELAPTVDAVEVVHGEWIYIPLNMNSDYFAYKYNLRKKCSACNYAMPAEYPNFNICPNCGAKMDGERRMSHEEL